MSNLLSDLSIAIYAEPLSGFRDTAAIRDLNNPLAVVMLLIDYETECSMSGIVTLLGNSAGSRLPETITALKLIGCDSHATCLAQIQEIAKQSGMTYDAIQKDRSSLSEFTVTSFHALHGDQWDDAAEMIRSIHDTIDFDDFWIKLNAYVERHEEELRSHIER
ncbi:MAG: DUF4375 domain-containing protein [Planctomycetaceae bacterium]|jgi:hypothetical protein|nr:DUF4375 domain-containing protein [Planctomycetaceae bacterium]